MFMEISIDLPLTWQNGRSSVIIDLDMYTEISKDLLLTWAKCEIFSHSWSTRVHRNFRRSSSNVGKCEMLNVTCLVIIDPGTCLRISIDFLLKWQNVRFSVIIDPGVCIKCSMDFPVTWKNVRCSVAIALRMFMEISIDLPLTWQNGRCSVIIDPDMCMEISMYLLLTCMAKWKTFSYHLIHACAWKFP